MFEMQERKKKRHVYRKAVDYYKKKTYLVFLFFSSSIDYFRSSNILGVFSKPVWFCHLQQVCFILSAGYSCSDNTRKRPEPESTPADLWGTAPAYGLNCSTAWYMRSPRIAKRGLGYFCQLHNAFHWWTEKLRGKSALAAPMCSSYSLSVSLSGCS